MGQPAARLTDMHTCPMFSGWVPHVGGPIVAPCMPNVLIGGLPAARVTDMAVCCGPPDVIVQGSPTVLIGGLMAARIGDRTAHGGVIVMGDPTVLIGDGAGGGDDDDAARDDNATSDATLLADDDEDGTTDNNIGDDGLGTDDDSGDDADGDDTPDANGDSSDNGSLNLTKTWLSSNTAADTYVDGDNKVSLLSADAQAQSSIKIDPDAGQVEITPVNASFSASLLNADSNQSVLDGDVTGSESLVVGQVSGSLDVTGGYSNGTLGAEASAGLQAMLVQGTAQASARITLQSVYDQTVGALTDTQAPDSWDVGVVLGAQAQGGIGASATATAKAEINADSISLSAGAKAGFGVVGGLNLSMQILL